MSSLLSRRQRLMAGIGAAAIALLALSCGGGDEPTATTAAATVQPTATQPPAPTTPPGTQPTATQPSGTAPTATPASALPTATIALPTPAGTVDLPNPKTPASTVTIAVGNINSNPGINRSQGGEADVYWGASETLFMTRKGPVFGEPWLAKEWTVASDLSKVTITVQEGVQFHKGYGEMTAADVVWSINDASARTNPESIHAQAGDLAPIFLEWKAIDKYTLDAPFATFDPRWQSNSLSDGWQPTAVFSKKVYDEKGVDFMRDNIIGTGPFEVREWTGDKRVIVDAVRDHWRQPPQIQSIQYLEIPDASIRLAGMQTGEFDVADIQLKDIRGLVAKGFKTTGTSSGSEVNIAFAGNLWEKTHAISGAALSRVGLDSSKPWIGDPDKPDTMERARKVRWALAMSYDREELADVLADGLAWPTGIGYFNPRMPQFQEKWEVPYDIARAKQFLADAGYPNGFEIEIFGQSDTQIRAETAEAVGGFWQSDLGLKVTVQAFAYRVFRPTIVNRETKIPFINSCDDGRFPRPWDWPALTTMTSLTRGGFSCALESPFLSESWLKASREPDIQKRAEINTQVADYMHEQMLSPGTITIPVLLVYNPKKIESWEMRPSLSGPITSPENIVPAK